MKKLIAGVVCAAFALSVFARGTAVYYVAKQAIHAAVTKRTELFGNLQGGCGPYGCTYIDLITNVQGVAEANYKCGTSGTWTWGEYNPMASGVTQVPEGALSEGTCYQLSDPALPTLPDLYLQ
jgi:hypothetical protein